MRRRRSCGLAPFVDVAKARAKADHHDLRVRLPCAAAVDGAPKAGEAIDRAREPLRSVIQPGQLVIAICRAIAEVIRDAVYALGDRIIRHDLLKPLQTDGGHFERDAAGPPGHVDTRSPAPAIGIRAPDIGLVYGSMGA